MSNNRNQDYWGLAGNGKVPPQDQESEAAVLGACLLEKDTFEKVMNVIQTPEIFYNDSHQKVFGAMCELQAEGSVVDLLTVTDKLRKKQELEIVGGAYFLTRLTMAVLTSAHAEEHSRIIFEHFAKREMIRIAGSMISWAYDASADAFEGLDTAKESLEKVTEGISSDAINHIGKIFGKTKEEIDLQMETGKPLVGVTTGYDELDRLTHGLQKKHIVIIGARPSQGKTALILNILQNAAEAGAECLLFSLESSATSLVKRMASCKSKVPLENIYMGTMKPEQHREIGGLTSYFYQLPIHIDDTTISLNGITAAIRKWNKKRLKVHRGGVVPHGVVGIDYLQLMSVKKIDNREQQIAKISRELKLLAGELDITIIPLCQLNRKVEERADKKPGLADLRESGSLEQDANIALFIWWQDTGEKDDFGKPKLSVKLLVEKNKDGKTGPVELKFSGDIQRWQNLEDTTFDQYPAIPSGVDTKFQANASRYGKDDDNNPF